MVLTSYIGPANTTPLLESLQEMFSELDKYNVAYYIFMDGVPNQYVRGTIGKVNVVSLLALVYKSIPEHPCTDP